MASDVASVPTGFTVQSHPLNTQPHVGHNSASSSKGIVLPPTPSLSDNEHDGDLESKSHLEQATDRPQMQPHPSLVFERTMGDTEVSYYLPSRADGVNDMSLHLGFCAPAALLNPRRVRAAWAYMRLIHTPLSAHVRMEAWEYTSACFVYVLPSSVKEALAQADATLEFKQKTGDALIDAFLNGPRTLNDKRLSQLVIGHVPAERTAPPPTMPNPSNHMETFLEAEATTSSEPQEFDLLICATHFIGDGMALHTFANEFFKLIAGKNEEGKEKSTEEIEEMLEQEWETRWGSRKGKTSDNVLPPSIEEALPEVNGRFRNATAKIDFMNSEKKNIGGHAFARKKSPVRHTVIPTMALDMKKTKAVLKKCKENGVSIGNAIFSLSAVAWSHIKTRQEADKRNGELPLMMYTAPNMRPYLLASATANSSYWFTAIGYLNVVLPSFLPSSSSSGALHQTFWHRARSAKKQISQAVKHPLLVSRTHEMARAHGERSRKWAREDDEKDAGIWVAPTPTPVPKPTPQPADVESAKKPWTLPPVPSTALVGLSLTGNLDRIYAHAAYPSLVLHTITTGSRQRAGAALLFGYTFAGRLWLSLAFDEQGFEEGIVEGWWSEVLKGVDEFLID